MSKTDAEILADTTRCLAAYGTHLARSMNGELLERDHVALCNPTFLSKSKNMVVPLRTLSAVEANELAALAARLYGRPDDWVLWSVPDQPHFPGAGFERYPSTNPVMTLGGGVVNAEQPTGNPQRELSREVADDIELAAATCGGQLSDSCLDPQQGKSVHD